MPQVPLQLGNLLLSTGEGCGLRRLARPLRQWLERARTASMVGTWRSSWAASCRSPRDWSSQRSISSSEAGGDTPHSEASRTVSAAALLPTPQARCAHVRWPNQCDTASHSWSTAALPNAAQCGAGEACTTSYMQYHERARTSCIAKRPWSQRQSRARTAKTRASHALATYLPTPRSFAGRVRAAHQVRHAHRRKHDWRHDQRSPSSDCRGLHPSMSCGKQFEAQVASVQTHLAADWALSSYSLL